MEPLSLEVLEKLEVEDAPKSGSMSARAAPPSNFSSSTSSTGSRKKGKLTFIKKKVVGTTQMLAGTRTGSDARLDVQAMMAKHGPGHQSLREEDFRSALQSPTLSRAHEGEDGSERRRNPLGRAISKRFIGEKKTERSSSHTASTATGEGIGRRKSAFAGYSKDIKEEAEEGRSQSAGGLAPDSFLPVVLDDDSDLHASLQNDSSEESSSGDRLVSATASLEDVRSAGPETPSVRRAKFLQKYTKMQSGLIRPPSQSGTSLGGTMGEDSDEDVDSEEDPITVRVSGTNKRFHKRFKHLSQETVNENFLCALLLRGGLLSQGSMYITTNYVCFYSNIIAKKTKVAIKFTDILSVRKCKILRSIPNSIEIHTPFKKYFWASFLHRDVAYDLINRRWRTMRKKMGQPVIDEVADPDAEIEREEIDLQFSDEEDEEEIRSILELNDNLVTSERPPVSLECSHSFDDTAATRTRYTEVFPITVEEFYRHFLSNKGDRFWKEFHSKDGYHDFSVNPWNLSPEGCCVERHAEFRAPIHMSFATKFTRVMQQQRCRFLSKDALLFNTSSHSRDVPYSNQFLVNAKWKVVNTKLGYCKLTVSVHVMFTRKNWLRSMIERNAIEGSREWFENWIKTALKVAKLIKQDSMKPAAERRPKIDMLRQSMGVHNSEGLRHFQKLRSSSGSKGKRSSVSSPVGGGEFSDGEEDREKQGWAQEGRRVWHVLEEAASQYSSMQVLGTFLLVVGTLFLTFCFCTWWYVSSLQSEISELEEQKLRMEEHGRFLEAVLDMAHKSSPGAAELVGEHSDFWRARGALEVQLAHWKDLAASVQHSMAQMQESFSNFALPRASRDADFIAAINNALAGPAAEAAVEGTVGAAGDATEVLAAVGDAAEVLAAAAAEL